MLTTNTKQDRDALFALIKKNAFFREKIVLSSGKESDYYIDARRVTLTGEGVFFAAKLILALVQDDLYDAIGGPTLGADPMIGAVGVVAFQSGRKLNTFIVRKAPKAHGKQQQIEGPLLPKGAKVILIDDVATTGKAFVESIAVMEKEGFKVLKAVCIVDRGEGASEALAKLGCPLVSIFKAEEFLK